MTIYYYVKVNERWWREGHKNAEILLLIQMEVLYHYIGYFLFYF